MSKRQKEKTKKKGNGCFQCPTLDVYEEASLSSSSFFHHIFLSRPSIVRKPTSIVPPILAHIPFLACPPDWVSWSLVVPLTHPRTTRPAWERPSRVRHHREGFCSRLSTVCRYAQRYHIPSHQALGAATEAQTCSRSTRALQTGQTCTLVYYS